MSARRSKEKVAEFTALAVIRGLTGNCPEYSVAEILRGAADSCWREHRVRFTPVQMVKVLRQALANRIVVKRGDHLEVIHREFRDQPEEDLIDVMVSAPKGSYDEQEFIYECVRRLGHKQVGHHMAAKMVAAMNVALERDRIGRSRTKIFVA